MKNAKVSKDNSKTEGYMEVATQIAQLSVRGRTTTIFFSPILSDGTKIPDDELNAYIEKVFASDNILEYDSISNGGYGIILKVQTS